MAGGEEVIVFSCSLKEEEEGDLNDRVSFSIETREREEREEGAPLRCQLCEIRVDTTPDEAKRERKREQQKEEKSRRGRRRRKRRTDNSS